MSIHVFFIIHSITIASQMAALATWLEWLILQSFHWEAAVDYQSTSMLARDTSRFNKACLSNPPCYIYHGEGMIQTVEIKTSDSGSRIQLFGLLYLRINLVSVTSRPWNASERCICYTYDMNEYWFVNTLAEFLFTKQLPGLLTVKVLMHVSYLKNARMNSKLQTMLSSAPSAVKQRKIVTATRIIQT